MSRSGLGSRPDWPTWCCAFAVFAFAANAVPVGAATPTLPGVPTITSVTAGVQNATVAFTAPMDDGGAPVFAYTATCTFAGRGLTASRSGAASPLRVGGMLPGKPYTCQVAARNTVGLGTFSAPSDRVIPVVSVRRSRPGTPTNVHTTAEVDSILLDWTSAPEPRGFRPVNGRRGKCTSRNGGVAAEDRVNRRALIVGPLTPGKTYTCVVQEANSNGRGPYSAPSNAAIPLPPSPTLGMPTITSVTPGVRRITVFFDKPAFDGGKPITHYRATCVSSDGSANARTGPTSPIVVLGLAPQRTYSCTVVAHTHDGDGPPSPPLATVVTLA